MYRNFQPDPRQEAAAKRLESVLGEGYWSLLEYLQSGLDPDVAELVATRIILATEDERRRSRFRLYVPACRLKALAKDAKPCPARAVFDAMKDYLGEVPTRDDFVAQCRAEEVEEWRVNRQLRHCKA